MSRRLRLKFLSGRWLIVWLVIGTSAFVASAREVLQNNRCEVAADETINGNLFVLCETLTINGTVNGTVSGIALRTTLNGTINGSVYLAGFALTASGDVEQSLHFAGITLALLPSLNNTEMRVTNDLIAAALRIDVAQNTRIDGTVFVTGYQLTLDGVVNREVNFWGSLLAINGTINNQVSANVGDPSSDPSNIRTLLLPFGFDVALQNPGLVVNSGARITDTLDYTGPVAGVIEGTVVGEVIFRRLSPSVPTLNEPTTLVIYGREVLREFTSLLVIGLLGVLIAPNAWRRPMQNLRVQTFSSFSFGLLAFILSFPVVFMLALFTLLVVVIFFIVRLEGVAVALGFALLVVDVTVAGVFYFIAIYVSRVVVAWAVGRFVLRSIRGDISARAYNFGGLALGILLFSIAVSLPAIGWVINALALFFGLGTILLVAINTLQQVRVTGAAGSAPYAPDALRVNLPMTPVIPDLSNPLRSATPPLAPLTAATTVGMDNLPPGFDPERFFRE